jgi:hypothetical protein
VRPALPCGTSPVQSTPSPSSNTWTNDIHLWNISLIKGWRLG